MFFKLTTSLALTISLMLASNVFAQTNKVDSKKAEEAKIAAAKKAEDDKKALDDKRAEEAKAAAEKAKAPAASTGFVGYMKSHFSASYHGEYYFTRKDIHSVDEKDHKIQDLKIMHNPTIIYRPVKNWKALVTSEFKYTDALAKGTFINRHFRSLVLFTRENILTEKENGLKLDVGFGRRIFDRNHGAATSYGNTRVNTIIGKKFGDNLTTTTLVQYLANDPAKGKINNKTWKHSLEILPTVTWKITDKLSWLWNDDFILNTPWHNDTEKDLTWSHEMNIGFISYQSNDKNSSYFQFKYLHTESAPFNTTSGTDDWFEYYVGHTYSFTPKISVTGEIGSKIFGSKDKKDVFAEEVKYPELAIYLDMAI